MSRCWTPEDQRRLAQARSDYERLLVESPGGISLVDPFYFEQTPIIEFCSSVSRNQHAESAEALVRRFARQHGIWLEDAGDHYNSQNGYCYPSASFRRLVDIGRSMAILFYLNDTIGRERMGLMSPAQAALGDCVRERLIRVCESFELRSDASGLERATLQVLLTLRRSAPAHWFQRFMLL